MPQPISPIARTLPIRSAFPTEPYNTATQNDRAACRASSCAPEHHASVPSLRVPREPWSPVARTLGMALTIVLALLASGVSPAQAAPPASTAPSLGTLHVCIDSRGLREYRDTVCAPHQTTERSVAFERVKADPTALARGRDIAREMDRRNAAALDRAARSAVSRAPARAAAQARKAPDACQAARAKREDIREHAVKRLSFAQRRGLDREVWLRCPNG